MRAGADEPAVDVPRHDDPGSGAARSLISGRGSARDVRARLTTCKLQNRRPPDLGGASVSVRIASLGYVWSRREVDQRMGRPAKRLNRRMKAVFVRAVL